MAHLGAGTSDLSFVAFASIPSEADGEIFSHITALAQRVGCWGIGFRGLGFKGLGGLGVYGLGV